MTLFWANSENNTQLSYDELVAELNKRKKRHPTVYTEDPSEVFIEILLAILTNSELTLLDSEFSEETLDSIGYDSSVGSETKLLSGVDIADEQELVSQIEDANDQWTLTLYTSGTTGTPTPVNQTFENLTRSVRREPRFSKHVWAFAYNPTHFAGLQVFFQAIMNKNPIVYIFEHSPEEIGELIEKHGITHISSTPTFYRLRLQQLTGEYETVSRLTSGGEKFEPSLKSSLQETFPNAKFRNVYAITEAGSLLESDGELFQIPDELTDKVEITEDSELIVHQSLLGESVSEDIDGEWFHTGDLVEFVSEDKFRFVGRESDFVNIGGYRVNPYEVEKHINSLEEIEAAVVAARDSSVTGKILVAEVQPVEGIDPDTAQKRVKDAISHLERWKQPRIIDTVDQIEQSRSGKRIRGERQ